MIENSQYLDPEVNIVPEEIQKSKFKKSQNSIRLLSAAADKSEIRLCCVKSRNSQIPKSRNLHYRSALPISPSSEIVSR